MDMLTDIDVNTLAEVLVVEDDPGVRHFAVMLLETSGFQVRSAETADAALALLEERSHQTAVILTDVQMPGCLDGIDLATIVLEQWPQVTVLVTSGSGQAAERMPPGTRFLPKPWNPNEVVALVEHAIAQAETRRS